MRTYRMSPKFELESYAEQREAKRYNPAWQAVWKHKGKEVRGTLSAGNSDDLYFWHDKRYVFCVSVNTRLDYAGMQVFERKTGNEIGEVFAQNDWELKEMLGSKGVDYDPATMRRRFWNEIQCQRENAY
jgi:hypothetical protein